MSPVDKQGVTCILWVSDTAFITTGPKHIKFWTKTGRSVNARRGKFVEVSTVGLALPNGVSILGTVKGNLLMYKNGQLSGKPLQSH